MGLAASSIYLDSCLAIYLVEENPTFAPRLESALAANPSASFCISPLTEMECLVMPLRQQNELLITKFKNWFKTVEILSLQSNVFHVAARLRADFSSLKTPDALHLAVAMHHKCDEFWTNDSRLSQVAPSLVKNIL